MTTFSFDPQCPSNLSPKYIDALSKIDATIDELAIRNDMTPNNEKVLTTITRKLHNDLLTHLERSRLVIDLQKSVEQVLSFTDIPDQILTKCEALSKRFPEEFHNVTYDFTNIKSFKLPALEDAKGALTNLKNHGYRQEAEPILNLLELIFLHYNLLISFFCCFANFFFFCLRRPASRRWTATRSRTLTARKMPSTFFRSFSVFCRSFDFPPQGEFVLRKNNVIIVWNNEFCLSR